MYKTENSDGECKLENIKNKYDGEVMVKLKDWKCLNCNEIRCNKLQHMKLAIAQNKPMCEINKKEFE